MNKELIINSAPQGVEIALLEDKKLVELHSEKSDGRFAVGDLYLGKVKKLIVKCYSLKWLEAGSEFLSPCCP